MYNFETCYCILSVQNRNQAPSYYEALKSFKKTGIPSQGLQQPMQHPSAGEDKKTWQSTCVLTSSLVPTWGWEYEASRPSLLQ